MAAGSVQTATVLFTDLVGSTQLRASLGHARADELRRGHDRIVASAVERHGGRVVKGLGDGLMATFAAASDAVASAVHIQHAIERANATARLPAPVSVRIGMSSGDVTWENDDCFGNAVVEASRLCDSAEGGEIRVSDITRLLASGMGSAEWCDRGTTQLRGLDHDVHVWSILWAPDRVVDLDLPPDVAVDEDLTFVGRVEEMASLGEAWKRAVEGRRQVAWIGGEAGIGKSRLARELARTVHDDGGIVLFGRSDEDFQLPFQPFSEALEFWLQSEGRAEFLAALGPAAGDLAALAPRLREHAGAEQPRVDPATERFRLLQAAVAWFETMTETAPVLLILDDLHWATQPTSVMLRHLLRAVHLPLLVVGTLRPVPPGHALGPALGQRDSDTTILDLCGLTQHEVQDLIGVEAPRIASHEALVDAIWRRTDGNPFFLGEVLRELADLEDPTVEDVAGLGSTAGLVQMVGERLSRLSPDASTVLAAAAVGGSEVEVALLGAVSGLSEAALLDAVDETALAGLVEEAGTGSVRFAHDLVRETVAASLSAARRSRLHRRIAEELASLHTTDADAQVCDIAHHRLQASGPDDADPELLTWLRRAGECCFETAPEEAMRWYGEATRRHAAADVDRVNDLIALGDAQRRSGTASYRHSLMEAALTSCQLGLPEGLARAALSTNRGFATRTFVVDEEITGVIRYALDSIGPDDSALRAELMSALATELVFADDPVQSKRLSEQAVEMARRLGDPVTLGDVLLRWAHVNWHPGTSRQRLEVGYELEEIRRAAVPVVTQPGSELAFGAAFELGLRDEADAWLSEWLTIFDELCGIDVYAEFLTRVVRGALAIFDAQYERAEGFLVEAQAVGEAGGDPDWERYVKALYFHLWHDTGVLGDFVGVLEEQARANTADDVAWVLTARAYVEMDDETRAREILLRYLEAKPYGDRPLNVVWPLHILPTADLVADLGLVEHARPLYELLRPYAGVYPTLPPSMWLGCVDHALGRLAELLGDVGTALEHQEAALVMHDGLRGPMWMARSRLEVAALISPFDPVRGARLREEASDLMERHGLDGLRHRAGVLVPEGVPEQHR